MYAQYTSSGKNNKFGHFLVVVQLIHKLTQADIPLLDSIPFPCPASLLPLAVRLLMRAGVVLTLLSTPVVLLPKLTL